jgi:hypothetical protein
MNLQAQGNLNLFDIDKSLPVQNLKSTGFRNMQIVDDGLDPTTIINKPILGGNKLTKELAGSYGRPVYNRPILTEMQNDTQRSSSMMIEPCRTISSVQGQIGSKNGSDVMSGYTSTLIGQKTPLKTLASKHTYSYTKYVHPQIKNYSPPVTSTYVTGNIRLNQVV